MNRVIQSASELVACLRSKSCNHYALQGLKIELQLAPPVGIEMRPGLGPASLPPQRGKQDQDSDVFGLFIPYHTIDLLVKLEIPFWQRGL
jgi:hypothetical protein